jgi:hypothetical protein
MWACRANAAGGGKMRFSWETVSNWDEGVLIGIKGGSGF